MREIIKIAVASINHNDIRHGAVDKDDPEILKYFKKTAADLKAIAPKAKDFLYFTCVMMHAAEASLLDDNGNIRKSADGNDINASCDKQTNGSWVWNSSDSSILPYKNSNNDIFPEEELKKAYKKWVGKPLCLDHQSQSVDMIRGVIIDTVYDEKKKRVIALCALDKQNYPELARKVASGVAASVSMGTAVGKAICTEKGCHRVARVESEFCNHMRAKSCYGEINVDLSPIELSIVVNGADPGAKIRRVIADANKAASYVDKQKLDEAGITTDEAKSIREDIETKIEELQLAAGDNISLPNEGTEIEPPYGQGGRSSRDIEDVPDHSTPEGNVPQAASTARYASDVESILDKLREKVSQLDNFINKMASVKEGSNKTNEDTVMADYKKGYFQGGGGVNEPTPHQVKYPKEDSDSIRNNDDKQMNGQSPFPDVGPVDGMHPGYESFGESEEARKKRLQRLANEQEGRALRRQAAMDKAKDLIRQRREAYFMGGGDVNEPTPNKTKYPNETDYTKIRDNEDKQMNGEKPFPDVGKVDGLYGDDEAKKKKLLRATKLQASFIKAAKPDGSDDVLNSCWNIVAKDEVGNKRLVLSATVKELAGPDRAAKLYAGIATPEYGSKIIQTIREAGLEAAHGIFKGAQWFEEGPDEAKVKSVMQSYEVKKVEDETFRQPTEMEAKMFIQNGMTAPFGYEFRQKKAAQAQVPAPAMPGGQPGAAPDVGGPAPVPAGPVTEMDEDPSYAGETGSSVDKLEDGIRELGNLVAEMEKGVEGLKEEQGELDVTTEVAVEGQPGVTTAAMRKQLNAALIKGFKQAIAKTEDVKEELELVKHVVATGANEGNEELVSSLFSDAETDVKTVKKNVKNMFESFVSYANGNDIMAKLADGNLMPPPSDIEQAEPMPAGGEKGVAMAENTDDDLYNLLNGDVDLAKDDPEDDSEDDEEEAEKDKKEDEKKEKKEEDDDEKEDEDDLISYDADTKSVEGNPNEVAELFKNMSRDERDQLRVKLAQKGIQFSDMLQKAHPQGGFTTDLDVSPEGDLAKVEDLKEAHEDHMDVATSAPRNVREAAASIQRLVTAGQIDPTKDFPGLIAEGLDPQAVQYWKKLWGEAKDPEASKFVGDLVKDYHSKKASDEKQGVQVKIARSFELAYAMAERGLISRDPRSLRQQVDRVMKYDDPSFEDFAKTINKLPVKQASVSDVASVNGMQDNIVTATSAIVPPAVGNSSNELADDFAEAFSGRKY
jgi:hypothetical protein